MNMAKTKISMQMSWASKIRELLVQRTNSPLTQTFFWLYNHAILPQQMTGGNVWWSPKNVYVGGYNPEFKFFFQALHNRGRSRIFFRRGRTRLLLYFNANKPHSFFFFCRIPVVLENRRSSQGGVHPLHPPPRSAPDKILTIRRQWGSWWIRRRPKII